MITIPDKLKTAIQKNNLVIFVGAGLSINLQNQQGQALGNWGNLVKQIIGYLNKGGNQFDYLLQCLQHHEPITVLELIEKSKDIDKRDVYDFVKGFFELHRDNKYDLHKKIAQLSRIVVTTNYDTAFEESIPQFKNKVAYKGRNYELTKHKDDTPLLFKLHGCISDANSMVLFPHNYDDLYVKESNDAEHALAVLKNLVFNKTILFIGCGMGDFQINYIFKAIKEMQANFGQPHFIISKDKLDSSLDFLTPVAIQAHAEVDTVLNLLLDIKEAAENERNKERIEQEKQTAALKDTLAAIESKHEKLIGELFQEAAEFYNNEAFDKAAKKCEQISSLEELDIVFFNWGASLGKLAGTKSGAEAEDLYWKAIDKFKAATVVKPDYYEAFFNWGATLGKLARVKSGADAEKIYHEAFDKYDQALKIRPDKYQAFNNWAFALVRLASSKSGADADTLYEDAFAKYGQAIAIKPDYYEAYNNWGVALGTLAGTKTGAEAETLYQAAFNKYEQAIALKSDYHGAFNNWGNALGTLAASKSGAEAEELYDKAKAKYHKAIELGGKCYNLACLYALLNNKVDALFYLDSSLTKKEVHVSFVKADTDWKQYWQDADFLNLLEKYSK